MSENAPMLVVEFDAGNDRWRLITTAKGRHVLEYREEDYLGAPCWRPDWGSRDPGFVASIIYSAVKAVMKEPDE